MENDFDLGGIYELVGQGLFDTVAIDPCPMRRSYSLFCTPVGMMDPTQPLAGSNIKTWLHTSQLQPGMNPAPNQFRAYRINALFLKNNRPLRIYETGLYCKTEIQFSIRNKYHWSGPAWKCASPFAIFETPKKEIANLKQKYGVDWEHIGGNLGFRYYVPKGDKFKPLGSREGKLEPASIENLGELICSQEPFTVTARIYDEGPQDKLQLAVHLDGITARVVI